MAGSDGLDLALVAGAVAGVGFAIGRVYTGSRDGSGLLVAWVVGFWGSSPASFPLLSSLNKGRICSFFFPWPIYYTKLWGILQFLRRSFY